MSAHVRSNPVFDRLLEDAIPALLAGAHRRDEPPVDGGRWPVSVVCVPDGTTREVLAGVMDEAVAYAGPGVRADIPGARATYAQTSRNDDGTYVVEYRDGGPARHFGTVAKDMRSAHALVTGWAQERPDWRDSATWRPVSV